MALFNILFGRLTGIAEDVGNRPNRGVDMNGPFEDARIVLKKAKPGDLLEYQRGRYSVRKIHV